ncbi:MAG: hypothetical protein M0T83_11175 [Nitrospiraceae bacterium]|nr:hypothetical protein [Nitrospiraceae bacterium]
MNQNAFLLLYLLPIEGCRQRLGFRPGKILPVPGSSSRTLGGIHILLQDNKKALITLLPGYGEWNGARGFWTSSAEPSLPLRYRLVREGHRNVYLFEQTAREGVFLTLSTGFRLPVRKSIPFLDCRGGMVTARIDLGTFFSVVSVHVSWPGSLAGLLNASPKVVGFAYASATVTVRPVVTEKVYDYVPGAVLGGDMREVQTRPASPVR